MKILIAKCKKFTNSRAVRISLIFLISCYEFYPWVKAIFYEWAQRMGSIKSWKPVGNINFWWLMLNLSTKYIILSKFNVYLGIILVFSCGIFILSTTTLLFFLRIKTKIGSPLLAERRHFENKFLAGNDHVIDIFTSEDTENISLCISQYLTVYYIIKFLYKKFTKLANFKLL